jgi:hypothetical protein
MPVSSATIASDTALPRSGWFKVTRMIGPSCLVKMSGIPAPLACVRCWFDSAAWRKNLKICETANSLFFPVMAKKFPVRLAKIPFPVA